MSFILNPYRLAPVGGGGGDEHFNDVVFLFNADGTDAGQDAIDHSPLGS